MIGPNLPSGCRDQGGGLAIIFGAIFFVLLVMLGWDPFAGPQPSPGASGPTGPGQGNLNSGQGGGGAGGASPSITPGASGLPSIAPGATGLPSIAPGATGLPSIAPGATGLPSIAPPSLPAPATFPPIDVPPISDRTYSGGSATATVTGMFAINETLSIDTVASISSEDHTWLQFGVSGSSTPNVLITFGETMDGVSPSVGAAIATGGDGICLMDVVVTGSSVSGHISCPAVTAYDGAGGLGFVSIEVDFTASS